jgi:hypothetical protein
MEANPKLATLLSFNPHGKTPMARYPSNAPALYTNGNIHDEEGMFKSDCLISVSNSFDGLLNTHFIIWNPRWHVSSPMAQDRTHRREPHSTKTVPFMAA